MASYLQLLLSYIANNQTALSTQRENDIRLIVSPNYSSNSTLDCNSTLNIINHHKTSDLVDVTSDEDSALDAAADSSTHLIINSDDIAQQPTLGDSSSTILGNYLLNETAAAADITAAFTATANGHNNHHHQQHHHHNHLADDHGADHHQHQLEQTMEEQQLSNVALITNNCLQQQQMREYYSDYDILIGVRIATSLAILFVAFIIFVVYKTVCHEKRHNKRVQQNNLRLTNHLYNIS